MTNHHIIDKMIIDYNEYEYPNHVRFLIWLMKKQKKEKETRTIII